MTIKILVLILIVLGLFRIKKDTFFKRSGYFLLLIYGILFLCRPLYNTVNSYIQSYEGLQRIFITYLPLVLIIYNAYNIIYNKQAKTVSNEEQSVPVNEKSAQPSAANVKEPESESDKPDAKDLYDFCMDSIGIFSVKRTIFDSEMEQKIYEVLRSFIHDEYYIIPHVAFREIFKWNWWYSWKLTNKVTKMHFDFVIFNSSYTPIICIEIAGKSHDEDPNVIKRDAFKAALLRKNNLKLITINTYDTIPDDEIGQKIIQSIKAEISSREDYPVYCPKCNASMKIKYNSKTNMPFYGCSKYKADGTGCDGSRDLSSVPPLYDDILDSCKASKKANEQE